MLSLRLSFLKNDNLNDESFSRHLEFLDSEACEELDSKSKELSILGGYKQLILIYAEEKAITGWRTNLEILLLKINIPFNA
jgi:hypothetical protein